MSDPKLKRNYAVSHGPVNRRTAVPSPSPQEPKAPVVKARLQIAKAKHRLGSPLAQRLAVDQRLQGKHPDRMTIVLTMACAISAVGLLLGLIQNSLPVAGLCFALLCGLGAWIHVLTKAKRRSGERINLKMSPVVDASDIQHLDASMEKLAADASQETLDRFARLKDSITRCVSLMASSAADEAYASEDQLYIRECVRRYIPDSISSYLRVPLKDRASLVIDDNKSAMDLLHEQIEMIQSQLNLKETRLAQMAGESLMRQQRFLAAKTSTNQS